MNDDDIFADDGIESRDPYWYEDINVKLCGRCYEDVDQLYPAKCEPTLGSDVPIGMYHCPDCGAMVLAGLPHPELCIRCVEHKHPSYDIIEGEYDER
jgi:hypothetical protein